jgi:ABC-2 type transport system permease protein
MNTPIVRRLILKDLYLFRWMILASILVGAAAIAIMPLNRVSTYVGAISLICTLIVLNIFLVMSGVVQEKKDKVLLFILSLPVSTTQYVAAKVAANAIAFLVPWLVLTAATIAVIDVSAIPNGIVPYWVAVLGYILFYYCALLAVGLLWDSNGVHATAIIVGNVSINFLIPFLLALPSVSGNAKGPTAVWTGDIVAIVAAEILAGVLVLGLAVYLRSRTGDFV